MGYEWGMPVGAPQQSVPVGRASLFGTVLLNKASGGSIRVNDGTDGSDIIQDIFVDTYPDEDLLGGESVTWATSDTVFAKAIADKINEHADSHHYRAEFSNTDYVLIWPQDGREQDEGVITVDDISFTATIQNMDVYQAYAAAFRWDSPNWGADILPTGALTYAVDFDLAMRDIDKATGVEMNILNEDQVLSVWIGPRGYWQLGTTSPTNQKTFNVLAVAQGQLGMFLRVADASNPTFTIEAW